MCISIHVSGNGLSPEVGKPVVLATRAPPSPLAGDPAAVTRRLAEERDRVAEGMNDIVVHRLFSAALSLETALALIGDHPAARKVQEAVGELDRAIRDLRNVLFARLPSG